MWPSRTSGSTYLSGIFEWLGLRKLNLPVLIICGFSLSALYFASLYNFLLFHVLIEMFSVIVAFTIFIITWNTRDRIYNGSLILIGASYLIIGAFDLLHTVSYEGMGVLNDYRANTATQLWISARYLEALTLTMAPFFVSRKITMPLTITFFALWFIFMIVAIFFSSLFPVCYLEDTGLTAFKKYSEYIISAILLVGLGTMTRQRKHFDDHVYRLLLLSILLTIFAELMFTFYISVYSVSNIVGHFFKLGSFWLIYKAIIQTGLQQPYSLLYRELAQSEKRFRDLVDMLPTGICEIDPNFRITYVNPAGLKIIGRDQEDMRRGISLDMILDPDEHKKAEGRLKELFQHHPIGSTRYRFIRKDGAKVDVVVNSTPVFIDGELKTIQTSIVDVTELNRMHHRLQQANKMESIAVLAGGIAHEINNIMMGIIGQIELLRLSAQKGIISDGECVNALENCERISSLVKKLLAYSRGGRYQSQPINLINFLHHTLSIYKKQLKPDILLIEEFPTELAEISADLTQLEMVVSAILNNAIEAIEKTGRIVVSLCESTIDTKQSEQFPGMRNGRYVLLSFRDTGKGMSKKALQCIFEPFYSEKFPGRGLSMAAVFGIVKNHNGWIGVDSTQGRGTNVNVYFPVNEMSKSPQK